MAVIPAREAAHAEATAFLLSQIGSVFAAQFAARIADTGLTPRGYGVLSLLNEEAPPAQQQLADSLGIHRNVMVGVIDELESAGWVQRRRDPADRRAFRIHRTAAGEDVATQALKIVSSLDSEISGALSEEQATALRVALINLAEALGLDRGMHPSMQTALRPTGPPG